MATNTTVYDELVNNGDVMPHSLWFTMDRFTMPQIEEDPAGNMLDKFADFMSINTNAAKDTDYNFCVTCGSACVMTNDGYECQKCGIVKHSVGDFKDVHDDSMKILNFGGRKLYSIVDYSKTQKKNVLGQLLQLNDNKPSKYTKSEITMTPAKFVAPVLEQTPLHQQQVNDDINNTETNITPDIVNLTPEKTKNVYNTTTIDNMPEETDYKINAIVTEECRANDTDSISSECVFDSESSETPTLRAFYELSASSAPESTLVSTKESTREFKRQQTTVTICESSVVSTANSLQEPSIRFPKAILEKAADYYNMIQKVSVDQLDNEGKVCGQKRIVRRGDVKDEVIGYCIYCACVEMGMPRKEKEIAKFMRIKNNGLSRGKNFVRKLYCAGKINIPALDMDANDYYVKRYLTNLKLYSEETSNVFGASQTIPVGNSIFSIYKNYLDNMPQNDQTDNKQQNQFINNNKFVLKLVEESTRLGIGNNSNHISKIVGSIWVLICHLDLAADETQPRKKASKQKNATSKSFSYDKMYSRTPLVMNYEQAMQFVATYGAANNSVDIIWPLDELRSSIKNSVFGDERSSSIKNSVFGDEQNSSTKNSVFDTQEHDQSLQFVAIFAGTKHILIAGNILDEPMPKSKKQNNSGKSESENDLSSPTKTPDFNRNKITLTDLENACDGIRKNTFLKFSKCIEDNILLFIDVFNEFGIPHKVKGRLIKRKKNNKGIVDQLYSL